MKIELYAMDGGFVPTLKQDSIITDCKPYVVVTDGFFGNMLLKQAVEMSDIVKRIEMESEYFSRFNNGLTEKFKETIFHG